MLRVHRILSNRPSPGGSLISEEAVPGKLARYANRMLVTATRPPAIAVLLSLAALVLSITALSTTPPPTSNRQISITLPGSQPEVLRIPATTLFHTINDDFVLKDDGTTYVQTGDIPAMWLRDSSAQTLPYVRFANTVPEFQPIVRSVIERNARNVLTDPHANAFTAGYKIWEEKWEPDSLAAPVTLVYAYWQQTHDRAVFTQHLRWSLEHTLATLECEQHHDSCSNYRSRYLPNHGFGADFSDTGMIWGAFRPSDDPVRYPFNVPQNMLLAVALDEIVQLAARGCGDSHMATAAAQLSTSVRAGIERYGKVYDFRYGWIYAYETDGRGNFLLMDDANVPNLISASSMEYLSPDDPIYQNTRRFALSTDDPYYYRGRYASGLGSPHTPTGWVWPLGLIGQALTASSAGEVVTLLKTINATSGSEQLMHESFDPNDPSRFTRPEFGWANAVYAELLFRTIAGLPQESFTRPALPTLLPLDVRTPVVATLDDQLISRGIIVQELRFSCTNALPYCYIR